MAKIMHIEDDADTQQVVKTILEKQGHSIVGASNGVDALKILGGEPNFGLILIDIMLPDMSGWDIFEKLKKMKHKAKVIFLSAIPVSEERIGSLKKQGVSDYIEKPFSKSDLISRIQQVLSK
jgi:DNA-binding response OmpR family regulator